MEYLVVAEIEIDGTKIEHYTSITLRQKFNEHHEFIIRINHDVLESSGSFSLDNAQKKIGKSTLIRLQQKDQSLEVAYEFKGIICEVRLEQSGISDADLVLVGYSPTILLETGPHLASFLNTEIGKVVQQVTKPLDKANCKVNIEDKGGMLVSYLCQYRESGFHFLNRLSSKFGYFFYYDGKELFFGKPSSTKSIEITYGEDVSSMQLTLQVKPMNFSNYTYISKEDKLEKYEAPSNVNGMGQYASRVLKESNNLFSEPVNAPLVEKVENKSALETMVKTRKASMAADLEVLTGTSYNPKVSIGMVIDVKTSRLKDQSFVKEDYGKFLVTSISHHINENGKYYNSFEAVPSEIEVLPVDNVITPLAEPQIAIVKDNKDPGNGGRVKVQMLWQKGNETTSWIRVMTPDAGGGKDGAKNRGLVVIPEVGDQVLINFYHNDPDSPFVMGSLFHGKSGGGGGSGNKSKSLIDLAGSSVILNGGAITISDSKENLINLDGAGNITLKSSESIALVCGDASINIKKDGTIEIKGKEMKVDGTAIDIKGSEKINAASGPASFKLEQSGDAKIDGIKVGITGNAEVKTSGPMITVSATGILDMKGAIIKKNA